MQSAATSHNNSTYSHSLSRLPDCECCCRPAGSILNRLNKTAAPPAPDDPCNLGRVFSPCNFLLRTSQSCAVNFSCRSCLLPLPLLPRSLFSQPCQLPASRPSSASSYSQRAVNQLPQLLCSPCAASLTRYPVSCCAPWHVNLLPPTIVGCQFSTACIETTRFRVQSTT